MYWDKTDRKFVDADFSTFHVSQEKRGFYISNYTRGMDMGLLAYVCSDGTVRDKVTLGFKTPGIWLTRGAAQNFLDRLIQNQS